MEITAFALVHRSSCGRPIQRKSRAIVDYALIHSALGRTKDPFFFQLIIIFFFFFMLASSTANARHLFAKVLRNLSACNLFYYRGGNWRFLKRRIIK